MSGTIILGKSNRWDKLVPYIEDCKILESKNLLTTINAVRKRNDSAVLVGSLRLHDLILGLASRYYKRPYVVRLRGALWKEDSDKWERKILLRYLVRFWHWATIYLCLRLATEVWTVSNYCRDRLIEKIIEVHPAKIFTLYNPVDPGRFKFSNTNTFKDYIGLDRTDNVILMVTNFNYLMKYGAIAYFMPAIEAALEGFENWHFVILGSGVSYSKRLEGRIENLAPSLKDRIHLPGHYSPIEDAYADADIVLHLTFRETAPNVVMEAKAAGKYTIVNTFGGSRELLRRTFSGILSNAIVHLHYPVVADEADLYASLKLALEEPDIREKAGQANYDSSVKDFEFDKSELNRAVKHLFKEKK